MSNIIAVIWDFDGTMVRGCMQDPIFEEYKVDAGKFWSEVDQLPKQYKEKGIRVNRDTIYLNHFIHCAHEGMFPGLNTARLHEFGKKQDWYQGIVELLKSTKDMLKEDPECIEYGIKVEHYIVSNGMAEVIRGSEVAPYVDGIWGCELLDAPDKDGEALISEVVYTIDNTTKTRALFEINKGIDKIPGIDVNSSVPKEMRRVQMENMIYIADGPSDIPAFSVVRQNGGATFAVYERGNLRAMEQVERMRIDNRVDMYAEADYSEGTMAHMWITNRIRKLAENIKLQEKTRQINAAGDVPRHLNTMEE